MQLCIDGTCADLTAGKSCDPEAESPCGCDTLPFICAKQVDLEPTCTERFTSQYDAYMTCLEEQVDSLPQVDFKGPWFMACYVSLPILTFLMLIWCAWNQRWASVSGSTVPLELAKFGDDSSRHSTHGAVMRMHSPFPDSAVSTVEQFTQTGYKTTIIGLFLYFLIVLAHVIIQFLLFALTVEYCESSKHVPFPSSRFLR